MISYAHPEVLVDTQWVADHLNAPKGRVIEVGYALSNFNSGHISGAVGWGWSTDFQQSIRKDLPDKREMEELLSRSELKMIRPSLFLALVATGTRRLPCGS